MNMEVRLINDAGILAFREYLADLRSGLQNPIPVHLLVQDEFTLQIEQAATVEPKSFGSRMEAAAYLSEALRDLKASILDEPGLWSWLSIFYFDQLCPAGHNGTRHPGKDYRYILTTDYTNYYRHLLAGPFRIYQTHRTSARIFLVNALDKPGEINEQFASRQDILSKPGLIAAADLLYFSDQSDALKRGARGKGQGSARRFATMAYQLDLTYDLYSMKGEEIAHLLPAEFDRFRLQPADV